MKFDDVDRFACRCNCPFQFWSSKPFSRWYTAKVLRSVDHWYPVATAVAQ